MTFSSFLKVCAVSLPVSGLLGACAETELVINTAKQIASPAKPDLLGDYKVGNPYPIKGVWYYPKVDYDYVETGIASWYGPNFHGKKTANGAIFDQNEVTAAHRTLQLPSIVRVTNLRNGRSLKVLVNDRGPFARGRIIDLSRRSAQLLGIIRSGTAPVRVEIIADESRKVAALAGGKPGPAVAAVPSGDVSVAALPGGGGTVSTPDAAKRPSSREAVEFQPVRPEVSKAPVSGRPTYFIQAGAFVHRDLAEKMRRLLTPLGPTEINRAVVGKQQYYRVRLGPVRSVKKADQLLDLVVASGYPEARVVVE